MELISTGRNVEQAIEKGLKDLNLTREEVEVEVISEGALLKSAKVRIVTKGNLKDRAEKYLLDLLEKMGFQCAVNVIDTEDGFTFDILGTDTGAIIGYRGEVLDSLQYLTSLYTNRGLSKDKQKRIILDCEGYREKRKQTLIDLANSYARKVIAGKRSYRFEPMNPNERRIIHTALQGNNEVETYSEGEEPNRRVVIKLKGVEEVKPVKKNNTRYTKEIKFRSFGGKK